MPLAEVDIRSSAIETLQAKNPRAVPRNANRETAAGSDAAASAEGAAEGEITAEAEAAEDERIVMYSTSWCGFCRRARAMLDGLDVEWVEKDIEKNPKARQEYLKKTGGRSGVPVFDIGGTVVRGYKPVEVQRLIENLPPEPENEATDSEG